MDVKQRPRTSVERKKERKKGLYASRGEPGKRENERKGAHGGDNRETETRKER